MQEHSGSLQDRVHLQDSGCNTAFGVGSLSIQSVVRCSDPSSLSEHQHNLSGDAGTSGQSDSVSKSLLDSLRFDNAF